MSRVRGGMNSTEIRIGSGNKRVQAYIERVDLVIPLHKDAIEHIKPRLSNKTILLIDPEQIDENMYSDYQCVTVPFTKIQKEIGVKFINVFAVGVLSGIFKILFSSGKKFIEERFSTKGESTINKNIDAFKQGYSIGENLEDLVPEMDKNPLIADEILLDGNQAVGLGAIAGGCNFISAYPMSPSTGTLVFLAKHSKDFGIVVDQAEDEIAAINKALGAWFTGARAIVSTSGGGFALMNEGLSLAGMIESPLVVHIAQRPGPATGLPTRTAQSDLNLALYSGHGEFHRMIFAPGSIEQIFYLTQQAFNIADKLQIPVFILTDQYLVDSYYNVKTEDMKLVGVEQAFVTTSSEYKRYLYTENGISPRGIPGLGSGLIRVDSDEHDEWGHITEDLRGVRKKMVDKRIYKKGKTLFEYPTPIPLKLFGGSNPETVVLCWGSSYLVVKEAIEEINDSKIAGLHFSQVFPLPNETTSLLSKAKKILLIEGNATGQFAKILKLYGNIDIPIDQLFLKSNGEPISVEDVMEFIQTVTKNGAHE
jgi:2-oxoglutarate ferredoxin oxidoreductase subunit alpha